MQEPSAHPGSHLHTRSQAHSLSDDRLELHPVLAEVFTDFEQAQVRWCCLRMPSNLGAPESDIDLLIDPVDVTRVPSLLLAREFVRVIVNDHSTHWLRYDRRSAQWLWLHCTTELSFGPAYRWKTKAEAGCLDRRCREGPLAVLAPDDAFWVLLLHVLLDKGTIPLRHRASLQTIAAYASTDGPVGRIVETACPFGWTLAQLVNSAKTGDWEALEALGATLKANTSPGQAIGVSRRVLRRGRRLLTDLFSLGWWRRRGLSVALLGPDGAGKSTLAEGLKASSVFPVRLVYMGLTGGALPYVDLLPPGLVQLGRIAVLWSRYLRALYHQMRGRLVIFDRYIYDAMTPHPERLNWYRRATRWIDGHACPGPDLVLVLNAPGHVMYDRKGEYTAEMLEDWRQHFVALQDWLPQVELVDTTRAIAEVSADAMDRIWRRYAARLSEWYASRDTANKESGVTL